MTSTSKVSAPTDHSVGELVGRASEQLSALVREEIALAKLELADKGRHYGRGGGLFGGAGLLAVIALQALAATAIAALSLVWPVWAGALLVTGVLAALAGLLALLGRRETRRAAPLTPEATARSVRTDIETIKEKAHR
nr:phage holin family protein [Streptomyces sp. GC420]